MITRLAFLLTACLLGACSSDEPTAPATANGSAATVAELVEALQKNRAAFDAHDKVIEDAFNSAPPSCLAIERAIIEEAMRQYADPATVRGGTRSVAVNISDKEYNALKACEEVARALPDEIWAHADAPPLAAESPALANAGDPLGTFHIDELRPGEVVPLGVTVTRDGLPDEGQCVEWSESNPQIARGRFTGTAGHPWFEGRIEATNGAMIGRQSVDAWWPAECDTNAPANTSWIVVTSDIENISTNDKAGD